MDAFRCQVRTFAGALYLSLLLLHLKFFVLDTVIARHFPRSEGDLD